MSRVAASMPRAVRALVTGSWRSGGPAAQLPCGHGGRVHVSEGRLGSARLLGQRLQRQCSSSSSGGGQPDPETVSYLRDPVQNREVFLLGTAHVSEKSAEDVRRLIALVQPDHVFVELCDARASQLRMQRDSCSAARVEDSSFVQSLMSMQRHGSSAGFEAGAFLDNVIKAGLSSFYNIFRQYGLVPGVEFKAALEVADRQGIPLCYGDRNINDTVTRLRTALARTSWLKLLTTPTPQAFADTVADTPPHARGNPAEELKHLVEQIKNRRQIALLRSHLQECAPEVMDVMLAQRDRFMVERLLRCCPSGRIVAIVGMAHMDGIEAEFARQINPP